MTIDDLITGKPDVTWCLNVRGTNGSGKTSLARSFMESSKPVEIFVSGYKHPMYTYCVDDNVLLIGSYRNKCGGCDTLRKAEIVRLIKLAWMTECNVLFEGVLVGDSKEPYYWLMKEFNDTIIEKPWGFVYLDLSFETCLKRVYERNGGKPVKEEQIKAKWAGAQRYRDWQKEQGNAIICIIDAELSKESVRSQFDYITNKVVKGKQYIDLRSQSTYVRF